MENSESLKEKRIVRYTVRFTTGENKIITEKAKRYGYPIGVFLRRAGLHKEIKAKLTEDEKTLLRPAISLSNSLNQLMHAVHVVGALNLLKEIVETLNEINLLIKKFK